MAGSGWKEYQETQSICGIKLPEGLRKADKLPQAIFTPATKEQVGHDVNVRQEYIEKEMGKDIATKLKDVNITLYKRASAYAENR